MSEFHSLLLQTVLGLSLVDPILFTLDDRAVRDGIKRRGAASAHVPTLEQAPAPRRDSGARYCECGRRISANRDACLECAGLIVLAMRMAAEETTNQNV